MPQQKLTIVPVTLHTENEKTFATNSSVLTSNPTCTIKTANAEISFFNGVDEHIIQTVMRELKINETRLSSVKNIYIISCPKTKTKIKLCRGH